MIKLLTPGASNHKVAKGDLDRYESAVLHLAPHTLAGGKTVCPDSTKQCRATCLYWAGRGRMPNTQRARIERTKLRLEQPGLFWSQLYTELNNLRRRARGKKVVVRLDGTSDIGLGDNKWLLQRYPDILFYDYTKSSVRYANWLITREHLNRYLTFSRSETNWEDCAFFLRHKGTVTVVFWPKVPKHWRGYRVIDGDAHDFRFLDPPGVIVGLLAKGKAKKLADPSGKGFVVGT